MNEPMDVAAFHACRNCGLPVTKHNVTTEGNFCADGKSYTHSRYYEGRMLKFRISENERKVALLKEQLAEAEATGEKLANDLRALVA